MKNLRILPVLFLLVGKVFSQETITPIVDTYTQSSKADDVFSSDEDIRVKNTIAGTNNREAYLKFEGVNPFTLSEQILLRLVKIGGDEGNISIMASDNVDSDVTWNTAPSEIMSIPYGGYRLGDTCFFDVTDFVKDRVDQNQEIFTFKVFTTSNITSTIKFGSTENANEALHPQLIFYEEQRFDIPVFDTYERVDIPTENGTFEGVLLGEHTVTADERSTYGGWTGAKSAATGFFRIEEACDGTWHIIDPEGYIYYSAGLNTVFKGGGVDLPSDLLDLGLNTVGSWSDEDISGMAYCPRFNVMVNFKNSDDDIKATFDKETLPVFEPTFASFCQNLAETELPQYANDPWVLGFFLDNELLFHRDHLTISLTELETDNAQYLEADNWMRDKYGESYTIADITDLDIASYQGYVAETYFSVITSAFRAIDNHHLLIGTRFHAHVKYIPEIFEVAGNYLDVLSINYYNRFEPEIEWMEMWLERAEKPFMVTEFYTMGDDSGLGNVDGAGWIVPTQQDRANWYENWMLKLLRSKGSVGYHWFRYRDKDGQDSNKGLYNEAYEPYSVLAESFAKVSLPLYSLRSHVLYGNGNYNGYIDCNDELCGQVKDCGLVTYTAEDSLGKKENVVITIASLEDIAIPSSTSTIEFISLTGKTFVFSSLRNIPLELNSGYYFFRCFNNDREAIFQGNVFVER